MNEITCTTCNNEATATYSSGRLFDDAPVQRDRVAFTPCGHTLVGAEASRWRAAIRPPVLIL